MEHGEFAMRSNLHTAPGMGWCGMVLIRGAAWPLRTQTLEQQPQATMGLIMSCALCFRAR